MQKGGSTHMKLCKPRNATPKELLEIALCCSKGGPDLETVQGHLEGAAVAAFDHYTTDSPGYQGTVYAVIWPGGPELVGSFIREQTKYQAPDGTGEKTADYIVEASTPRLKPVLPGEPLDVPELVEGLEASGLSVHVIDENTDFSKLPPLKR